jgi:hypothetical protein
MGKATVGEAETSRVSCDVGPKTIGRRPRSDVAWDGYLVSWLLSRTFAVRSEPVLLSLQVIHRERIPPPQE